MKGKRGDGMCAKGLYWTGWHKRRVGGRWSVLGLTIECILLAADSKRVLKGLRGVGGVHFVALLPFCIHLGLVYYWNGSKRILNCVCSFRCLCVLVGAI